MSVSNTATYAVADWQNDISLAAAAHIDGFALNIAVNESTNGDSLNNAFIAANNVGKGFKLFLSFDYAGNGLWPKAQVISLIKKFQGNPAYYLRGSQPLVSTFEGPAASADWADIKSQTGCFFIPDWSSLGAAPAWAKGTADGLFSWAAWPTGPTDMSTFTDASYFDTLGGKPYMMAVSPWFYTNLPGFRKNWLWRGDMLWFDRWINVMYLQPEYVEIVTWNDYGESHYIGPLNSKGYEAFGPSRGKAPFNFVLDKPHDGWRMFLPYLIDMAKTNRTSFSQEMATGWYRLSPKNACGTGGTTGNTASQLQQTYSPADIVQDKIFYAAILGSSATVSVTVGGTVLSAGWTYTPSNNIGLYQGSVAYGSATGAVVITIRSSAGTITINGKAITSSCSVENWNANVEFASGSSIATKSPLGLDQIGCTSGRGDPKYQNLCEFTCKYDYCPKGACTCTSLGTRRTLPKSLDKNGCPAPGFDTTYLGLCSFGCNYGWCPDACKVYAAGTKCSAPLPTAPPIPVCTAGSSDDKYGSLCAFSCAYGFCPPEICTCTQAGTSTPPLPVDSGMTGSPKDVYDYGLCAWTCKKGKCPADLCGCSGSQCPTSSTTPLLGQPGKFYVDKNAGSENAGDCTVGVCGIQSAACGLGQIKIGFDKGGCSGDLAKPICCSPNSRLNPQTCLWRGSAPSCNGQCSSGEVLIAKSRIGGLPSADGYSDHCLLGSKVFCCQASTTVDIAQGCYWSGCNQPCASTETELLQNRQGGPCDGIYSRYCCPRSTLVDSCQWEGYYGSAQCDPIGCQSGEVQVGTSGGFQTSRDCIWGTRATACCKSKTIAPRGLQPSACTLNFCLYFPHLCEVAEDDSWGTGYYAKRGLDHVGNGSIASVLEGRALHRFEERAGPNLEYRIRLYQVPEKSVVYLRWAWPKAKTFFQTMYSRGYRNVKVYTLAGGCGKVAVNFATVTKTTVADLATTVKVNVEHVLEQQLSKYFLETAYSGRIRGIGAYFSTTDSVTSDFLNKFCSQNGLPAGTNIPILPTSLMKQGSLAPYQHVMDAFGSGNNPGRFVLVDVAINGMKGMFFRMEDREWSNGRWTYLIMQGLKDRTANAEWYGTLAAAIGVYPYLRANHERPWKNLLLNALDVGRQFKAVGSALGVYYLDLDWHAFLIEYFELVRDYSRQWITQKLDEAVDILHSYERIYPEAVATQLADIQRFRDQIQDMNFPSFNYDPNYLASYPE